ncbi:MAG: tRNA (guanosine(46)-N7)-methyltransferase TrmB [Oscillospiraceae bacterium]|nr:tRNA (guanosine(46)-N7)-methyltransferase TrmB [Oscillospiraceae bacterium]
MRRKPNLDSRIEKCAHLRITEPQDMRGRWLEEFQYNELHIELGCGKGRFTVETAGTNPGTLILAMEKLANVMVIALERADFSGVDNVRFIHAFADYLPEYVAPGEVSRIYINFPDPWPSNGHAKRRLTHRRFLEIYKQILTPGGEIHFKTDNLPLFEFSLNEFEQNGFTRLAVTRNLHENGPLGVMTDYELKFHNQGMSICHAIYRT